MRVKEKEKVGARKIGKKKETESKRKSERER